MKYNMQCKFEPGSHVSIDGEIAGSVEAVVWQKNSLKPIYRVQYWRDGAIACETLYEDQMSAR
jgi:hypothetical protein